MFLFYSCVYLCVSFTAFMQDLTETRRGRGHWNPRSWNYEWLWVAQWGCWELWSGPFQRHNHTKQSLRSPNLFVLRKQHILIFQGQVHIHAMLTYLISCLFHHHKYDTWLKTWSHDIRHAFMLSCLLVIILLQPPYKLNIYSCSKYLLSSDLLCARNVRSWSFKDKLGSSHVFKLRPFFTVGKNNNFFAWKSFFIISHNEVVPWTKMVDISKNPETYALRTSTC